jgi:hypothetical protein
LPLLFTQFIKIKYNVVFISLFIVSLSLVIDLVFTILHEDLLLVLHLLVTIVGLLLFGFFFLSILLLSDVLLE